MSNLSLLIIQPTPFCNVDCDYCYLPGRSDKTLMSMATLRKVLENVFRSKSIGDDLTVVWHAGEPLVVSIGFYKEALALTADLAPKSCAVRHAIQTNGTLISPQWCDFFLESEMRIGVSVDGPKFVHDARRKTRGGGGTYDRAMQGVRLLQEAKKDFHVISVLSDANIDIPEVMFDFYAENGIDAICFNVEESDGAHVSKLLSAGNARARFFAFLQGFMHLVRMAKKPWFVREFDSMRSLIFRRQDAPFGNTQTEPLRIVTVGVDGRFSTFSPEFLGVRDRRFGDFIVGDLTEGPIELALANPKFIELKAEIDAGVEKCRRTCEYFSVCGGGAPANKLGELGTMDAAATRFCECTVMAPADLVLSLIDERILSG